MRFSGVSTTAVLALLSQCTQISAAVPRSPLSRSPVSECQQGAIPVIMKVLSKHPIPGSKICSKILNRSPPATVSTTSTTTTTTGPTSTTTTTVIVSGGTSTVSGDSTVTSTTTVNSLVTVIDATSTVTVSPTAATITNQVTVTSTAPTVFITTTVTDSAPPTKRGEKVGDAYPDCPRELAPFALGLASTACNCFLGPAEQPKTTTVFTTQTVTSTIQQTNTAASTVPGTTVTSYTTTTVLATVTVPSTVKSTDTVLSTVLVTVTTSSATTTTVTPTATATSTVLVAYTPVGSGTRCVYNSYYRYELANNDEANNYAAGIRECEMKCTADTQCKFFFFYRSDPAFRNQGDTSAFCLIDEVPFDSTFLQCNVGFVLYYSSYNKNV